MRTHFFELWSFGFSKWFWNSWVLVRHYVALASALRAQLELNFACLSSFRSCCLCCHSISLSLQKFRNIHNKVSKWVKAPLLTSILQTFSPPWHEKYPELCNTQNGWYIFIKKSGMIHNNTIKNRSKAVLVNLSCFIGRRAHCWTFR